MRGVVQGVGFRYFVSDRAGAAGLAGWVRNLPDGGVECLLEGPRARVDELLAQLRKGPPWAEVQDLEISWEEPARDLRGFRVVG